MIFPLNNCRFGRLSSYHASTLEFQITTRNPLVPTVGWRVPVLLILLPLFAFTAVTGRFVQPPFNCLIDGYGKVGCSQCGSGSCSESLKTNNIQVMLHSLCYQIHVFMETFHQNENGCCFFARKFVAVLTF